jgi:hypothetical protein
MKLGAIISFFFVSAVTLLLLDPPGDAASGHSLTGDAGAESASGPHYGVDFITSAEGQADAQQFANAQATGAGWDRWPIYWFYVETSQGVFDWSRVDQAVTGDLQ